MDLILHIPRRGVPALKTKIAVFLETFAEQVLLERFTCERNLRRQIRPLPTQRVARDFLRTLRSVAERNDDPGRFNESRP